MIKKISILIPAYNEQGVLRLFYEEVYRVIQSMNPENFSFELFFVDDGSTDNTINILHRLRIQDVRVSFISLSRNFGKEIALVAGLDHILPSTDAVIIMDADLQHPPSLIPKLINSWEAGNQDVYARRLNRDESAIKVFFTRLYYKILNFFTEEKVQNNIGDFRLLDRSVLKAFLQLRETQRYNKGLFSWVGFRKDYVNYKVENRLVGNTKWSYSKLFNLAIDGITSSTTKPLRIATFIGFIVAGFAFIWLIKVLFKTLIFGEKIQGYPSLIIIVLLLGGIQLMSLGLIGEYLAKVFKETKNRPLYFILKKELNEE